MRPIKCRSQSQQNRLKTLLVETVVVIAAHLRQFTAQNGRKTDTAATAAGLSTGTCTQTLVTPKGRHTLQMLLSVPGALDHITTIAEEEQPA